jgi:hypothetical protein
VAHVTASDRWFQVLDNKKEKIVFYYAVSAGIPFIPPPPKKFPLNSSTDSDTAPPNSPPTPEMLARTPHP